MRFALSQVFERNRQWPITRGQIAEQLAVQTIHLRANKDGDLSSVAPGPPFRKTARTFWVRIQKDILGEYRSVGNGFRRRRVAGQGVWRLTIALY
jgi:hypothetical protein